MDTNTANLPLSNRHLAIGGLPLNTKHRIFTCILLLVVLCALPFVEIYAQDSLTSRSLSSAGFPADLDSAKVDSFFADKGISLGECKSRELYYEIFRWYKTCYRYGGNSQQGIDCSHFVNMLCEKIYGKKLEGGSATIYTQCKPVKGGLEKAEEGDLLFFRIKKKRISHIGIYLQNGRFAHASTQLGVIISHIEEPYYKKHFYRVASLE